MNFIASVEADFSVEKEECLHQKIQENCFVLLHRDDNVLVCCKTVKSGEKIRAYGCFFTVDGDIDVGHKVAFKTIRPGEKVKKYGAPIGSALTRVEPGAHVHLHNMKSDYIPSHTREKENERRS